MEKFEPKEEQAEAGDISCFLSMNNNVNIMAPKTKIVIIVLFLLVASKLPRGADGVDIGKGDQNKISGSGHSIASINNPVASSSSAHSFKGLRAGTGRRLQDGDGNNNNNVTSRMSVDGVGTSNKTAAVDGNNSTADKSQEKEDDVTKWMNSLDPPVRIIVSIVMLGLFAGVITLIFVALWYCCGITPCDLALCCFACVCALLTICDDSERVVVRVVQG